ncbi:DUF898 family protein [Devosia sp.]|uniref:DUF898 family protein n=1 Tax=Devosia sp. TaxID=1871048 RepID=UPI002AFFF9FF|nr:DUF898 family protein [Devosia sp.]
MVEANQQQEPVPAVFTGTRRELAWLLLGGYLLLVPTIGLYRFWLTTWKRRFYWANTEIDGDALEYTGNAMQLLLGFLMALAVFVPLYGVFFYLSTQSLETALTGYSLVAALIWFLMGYAIYRARDFRLSRTLWRGIRCDQTGSAWSYALRRFGWSLLMLASAGLVYPFMAANLWTYRYRHSWYGDRRFGFTGNWKQLAGPFYLSYAVATVAGGAGLGMAVGNGAFIFASSPDFQDFLPLLIGGAVTGLAILFYQSRELTRMFSAVRLGGAALSVTIRMRSLLGMYVQFGIGLVSSYVALAIGGVVVLGVVASGAFVNGEIDLALLMRHMQGSVMTLLAIVFGYLLLLGAFSFSAELFLGLGFWKLVAGGASITGLDSLRDVRARAEDKAIAGEGLADALNVGGY